MHKRLRPVFLKLRAAFLCGLILFLQVSMALGMEANSSFPPFSAGLTEQLELESQLKQFVGIPYRRGGTTTRGIDCSGFVRLVYDQIFNIELPHNAQAQFKYSDLKRIGKNDLQPGDLIFFHSKGKKRINHVGVYLSDNEFIHASSTAGVTVSRLDSAYWRKRFAGTRRHDELAASLAGGPERVQFDSALQIPLGDQGSILTRSMEEFSVQALTLPDKMENPALETRTRDDARLFMHEVRYAQTLSDTFDLRLSAIHENFKVYGAWPDVLSATPQKGMEELPTGTADRMAFKLAGAFKFSRDLSVIPSVTFYDYAEEDKDILNTPERQFGLRTVFSPVNSPWTMSMMLKYAERDDFRDLTAPYNRFTSLGLSVRVGAQLTRDFKFSITGERENRESAYGFKGKSTVSDEGINNLFMSFDYNY